MRRTIVDGRWTSRRVDHSHSTRHAEQTRICDQSHQQGLLAGFWIRESKEPLHVELGATVLIPQRFTLLLEPQPRHFHREKDESFTRTRNSDTRLSTFIIFTTHNSDHNQELATFETQKWAIIATRWNCNIAILMDQNSVLPWPACHRQRQQIRRDDSSYTTDTEGLHAQISRLISRR